MINRLSSRSGSSNRFRGKKKPQSLLVGKCVVTNGLQLFLDAGDVDSYPTSGTNVVNLVGGVNSALTNGVGFSSSNNGIFTFDGLNDYIDTNRSFDSESFTLSAWIKCNDVSGYRMIFSKEQTSGWPWNYRLYLQQSNGHLVGDIAQSSSQFQSIVYGTNLADDNWHNVVFIRSVIDDKLYLYVDGSLVSTVTDTFVGSVQNSQEVWIGRSAYAGAYNYKGNISNVLIYNRDLSSSEISQNYNCHLTRFVTPTPTPTVTLTPTQTITPTITLTPTQTITPTPTVTPTYTITPTITITSTPTVTPTLTPTQTITPTITLTPTQTITPTITLTPTQTITPTVTPPPPPVAADPTLEIWYDFSDNTTVTLGTGTEITAVDDKSTGTVKPANSTGGKRPKQVTSYQNNLNVSYFDGANDLFTINPITNFQSLSGNTMIIVGKFNNASATNTMTQLGTNNAQRNASWLSISGGNYKIGMGQGLATTTSAVDTDFHIFTCVFDGTQTGNSRLKFRIDGANQSLTFTQSVSAITSSDTSVFYIGETADATEDLDGYIGEILLYTKALNSTEISNTENYLSNKWNIQVSQGPVTNDLVLQLDANNSSSYGGSGNTWTDIAGTTQNITFTGSPTFTSGSPSYFTFNGINQYGLGSGAVIPTTGYTKSVWVYLNAYADNNIVSGDGHFIFMGSGGTNHKIYCGHADWTSPSSYLDYPSTNTVNLNTWYNITLTFNTTDGMKLYINGVLDSSYTARKTAHPGTGTINLATYNGGNLLNGRISKVYCYNRSLTSQEVLQNYDFDKSQYGL